MTRVAVDRFRESYHLISNLECTENMSLMPESEALDAEVRPCHSCFSKYYDNTGALIESRLEK